MVFTQVTLVCVVAFCVSYIYAIPSEKFLGKASKYGFEKALGSFHGAPVTASASDLGYSPSGKCLPSLDSLLKSYYPKAGKSPSRPSKTTENLHSTPKLHNHRPSSTSANRPLSKRTLNPFEVSELARRAENYVRINWVRRKLWRKKDDTPLSSGSLGTAKLCGCTTIVIWSSIATILAHIEEARGKPFPWWKEDAGKADQDIKDQLFLSRAYDLTKRHFDTTHFPPGQTHAFIIAPHMNPDDKAHRALRLPNDFFYKGQIEGLERIFSEELHVPYTLLPFHPTSSLSVDFQNDKKDTVLVNIERYWDNLALRLYANGRETEFWMDLGRPGRTEGV